MGAFTAAFTLSGGGGTVPSAANVRSGVAVGATTGTLVVPAASGVLNTVTYDNGTVGTYVPVATSNVRSGTTYGAASALTGTLAVPSAGNVLSGVSVDSGTGTYVVVAPANVRSGTTFGAASAQTGTLVLPAQNDVELGVSYGAAGTEYTGTLVAGEGETRIVIAVQRG